METIELDGAQGEGGGQILRSALTLAMITGRPFRIARIRARRSRPGLLRQHLTAVGAAAEICGARVTGAEPGSQSLHFVPGPVRGGDYRFAVGTAGSCTLVLQTVLPALWHADGPSTLAVTGGTHNPAAPPADFLVRAWLPLVRRMGAHTEIELVRHGFYPAGGGELRARVAPSRLVPLALTERGRLVALRAEALVAGVPTRVAQRELEQLSRTFPQIDGRVRELPQREGPGNAVMIEAEHEHVTELFTGFGEKGRLAERVAAAAADEAAGYLAGGAAVGEHLADQLVLPLALAGGGRFTATACSSHLTTNLAVIGRFMEGAPGVERADGGYLVSL